MENKIIQDYGKTVSSEVYINALQGHQYIPQSDQCILNKIRQHFLASDEESFHILDLGCGPGRLTFKISEILPTAKILGIDISESFISYAQKKVTQPEHVAFRCEDFTKGNAIFSPGFDVILMQGVMHHVHDDDRAKFLQRSFELLKPDGILIIGDEFIKNYNFEIERKLNVCKFYLHIIDEARKGGFDELAEEEAKNLIDDVLSGEETAGVGNKELFNVIYEKAELANKGFYAGAHEELDELTEALIDYLRKITKAISLLNSSNFNRGDYKTSTEKFADELQKYNFVLEEKYEIGPVDVLGGMGVLVFMKR